jgi:LysM repeat protein
VVRAGENLFRIGKAYDVSHEELARLNGIKDAGQIRVGQRIFIPAPPGSFPSRSLLPANLHEKSPPRPNCRNRTEENFSGR